MPKAVPAQATGVAARLEAFILERYPFALPTVQEALRATGGGRVRERDVPAIESLRLVLRRELKRALEAIDIGDVPDPTPGVTAERRIDRARKAVINACDALLAREAIAASLTREERIEILRGMILTRAVDNRLKQFFTSGEVRYGDTPFQGKGFRSLGQEAIYAAGIRLRRGAAFRDAARGWSGDVVGPIIRDLGVALAMRPEAEAVRMVLNAQMGKAGPPMNGKDLHIGDLDWGVLPAAAPLTVSTLTVAGMAMAFSRDGSGRVAISFIGEGGSSLGEWHEAINLCAARRLPAVFCIENNQTALSTPVADQSAVSVFADKAVGYGMPGFTVDGTDPEAIAAAFTWAADRARAGDGPTVIELVSLRMCGHAHHDDMLYLGKEPAIAWGYPPLAPEGAYANRALYQYWATKDPIATYAAALAEDEVIDADDLERYKREAEAIVEGEARAIVDAPWPAAETAGVGVVAGEPPRARVEV